MKQIKLICLLCAVIFAISVMSGCAKTNNSDSGSSAVSNNNSKTESSGKTDTASGDNSTQNNTESQTTSKAVSDITESVTPDDKGNLSDNEKAYIEKLLKCLQGANFSSKFALDDQTCMQYIENILKYEDFSGDRFFAEYSKDSSGNLIMTKEAAETICKTVFNYDLEHTSDYLIGNNYLFPASSAPNVPSLSYNKDIKKLGSIYQLNYTLSFNTGKQISQIASLFRTDSSSYPFSVHSITINE